ncbi:MAG: hypothetical protein GXN99_01625 [Candidatus Nanohaloarchaeota archaeon]|nr:hypothetical protein [Candidatus Nanohaloarchaeota archaeon]
MLKKLQSQVISIVLLSGIAIALAGGAYYWGLPLIEKTQKNVEMEATLNFMEELLNSMEEVALSGNTKVLEFDVKGRLKIGGLNNDDYYDNYIEYMVEAPLPSYSSLAFVPLNDYPPYKKDIYVLMDGENVEVSECNLVAAQCIAHADCTNHEIIFSSSGCVDEVSGKSFTEGATFSCNGVNFKTYTFTCDIGGYAFLETDKIHRYAGIEGRNKPLVLMARTYKAGDTFINVYRIVEREIDNPTTSNGVLYHIVGKGQVEVENKKVKITISKGESRIIPGGSQKGGDLTIIDLEVTIE